MDIIDELKKPFDVSLIHWRVGATNREKTKGIALAYIDARDVMKRLDDVMGNENWQNRYTHVTPNGVICELGLFIDGQWLWKANGAGETSYEAEKGAMSDAFKRAAVMWGIGRYLYYLPNQWVDIEPAGRSHKIVDIPKLPGWAYPEKWKDNIVATNHYYKTQSSKGQK